MIKFSNIAISFLMCHAFALVAMSCFAAGFKEEAAFFAAVAFYLRLDDLFQVTGQSREINITVGSPTQTTPPVAEVETK